MTVFEILVVTSSGRSVMKGPSNGGRAEPGGDRKIQSHSRSIAPPWKENVGRSAGFRAVPFDAVLRESSLEGAWLKQTRLFELWGQTGASTTMIRAVANHVVSFGPVAAVRADKSVVAVDIHYSPALRASELIRENGGPKPSLQHGFEEDWFDLVVGGQRWQSMQPLARIGGPSELKVGQVINLLRQVGFEALEGMIIQGLGEEALRRSLGEGRGDTGHPSDVAVETG